MLCLSFVRHPPPRSGASLALSAYRIIGLPCCAETSGLYNMVILYHGLCMADCLCFTYEDSSSGRYSCIHGAYRRCNLKSIDWNFTLPVDRVNSADRLSDTRSHSGKSANQMTASNQQSWSSGPSRWTNDQPDVRAELWSSNTHTGFYLPLTNRLVRV